MEKKRQQLLILIAIVKALSASFPLLQIANKAVFLKGIPLLYLYLSGIWLLVVAVLWWLQRQSMQ